MEEIDLDGALANLRIQHLRAQERMRTSDKQNATLQEVNTHLVKESEEKSRRIFSLEQDIARLEQDKRTLEAQLLRRVTTKPGKRENVLRGTEEDGDVRNSPVSPGDAEDVRAGQHVKTEDGTLGQPPQATSGASASGRAIDGGKFPGFKILPTKTDRLGLLDEDQANLRVLLLSQKRSNNIKAIDLRADWKLSGIIFPPDMVENNQHGDGDAMESIEPAPGLVKQEDGESIGANGAAVAQRDRMSRVVFPDRRASDSNALKRKSDFDESSKDGHPPRREAHGAFDPRRKIYRKSICMHCWTTRSYCDAGPRCRRCQIDNVRCIRKLCELGNACQSHKCPRLHPGDWDETDDAYEVEEGVLPDIRMFNKRKPFDRRASLGGGDYYRPDN